LALRPRFLAAVERKPRTAQAIGMLIGLAVDVNAYNIRVQYHATPLHNAVCSGSFEAVKMLVEAGAKLETKDTVYQSTPLTWAEYYLREEKGDNPAKQYAAIVTYLREKGRNERPCERIR